MSSQSVVTSVLNGVDVQRLNQTVEVVANDHRLAAFRFRTRGRWLDGAHNQVSVHGFYGAGAEQPREEPFHLEADEPAVLLGRDQATNPVELLLSALSACVTTSIVYHAAARGIRIEALETSLEGDLDLRGFLGLDPAVRKGLQGIRARVRIKSDAPPEVIEELSRMSPVLDSLRSPVPVSVEVETV